MKKTLRLLTILLLFILSLVITAYPAFGQLKEGNLIWTTTEENILYILRSNETEPSVFLDILKTFNIEKKYQTGMKLVSNGKSVFWLDYGYKMDEDYKFINAYIYKMDIDSLKPSVVVDLSQKAGSQIVRWLPSSLITDGKSLFWLGRNSEGEGKLFIYRSDINGGNFSVFFEFPYKSMKPKNLTTDGKFIYMYIDGARLNKFGGIAGETQFLVKIEISNPVLSSIDALSILQNWAGAPFFIYPYTPLVTDGKFLYFAIYLSPRNGQLIVRSDLDGQNPLMIAEPKYNTSVLTMTNNKNSLFWILQYHESFQIHQSTFDGSSKSILLEVPVNLKFGSYDNLPSSIAFVSNNYLSSKLIIGVVIFLISLAIVVGSLWIFSKQLSNSDIKQEAEPEV
ncbi:MAG: hypothetical protein GPJ22_17480 [Microcystis aeruginosa LL13-03]|jgi:hypothetical protein|nr:hypothetical protein [Microcystis aeruginosa LL13-03]NCS21222.1 hypothetical protein [Microcystis aeruginosa G11-06]